MSVSLNKLITRAYEEYGVTLSVKELKQFLNFITEESCKNILGVQPTDTGLFLTLCKLCVDDGVKLLLNSVEPVESVQQVLGNNELDLLFLDSVELSNAVSEYKSLVKDGGYIVLHNPEEKFWNEIKNQYEVIQITDDTQHKIKILQVFKHRKKLDISVSFEAPDKIHVNNHGHYDLNLVVSIRDNYTKVPIYFCDMPFSVPNTTWWIVPLPNYNWMDDKHFSGEFLIEFYDRERNFLDSRVLKVKDFDVKHNPSTTRVFSPFDCLWINYRQMFLLGIYDPFEMDNLHTVLDIGANVGIFTHYIAGRGARHVHAIEPTTKAFNDLKSQFYYQHGIHLHKVGIDSENGQKTLFTNNENSTISSFLHKTSSDISEELIDMYTLPMFYKNNGIDKVDLIKMDIEGMEYGIFNSLTDDDVLLCERYLIEYHSNSFENNRAQALIDRLKQLGYNVQVFPDVPENTQGFFFAKKEPKVNKLPTTNNDKFPKRAFVTFTNEYYLPITEKLVQSLSENSSYPVIVYSINCDVNFSYPNMFTKRIESDMTLNPKFQINEKVLARKNDEMVEVELPKDSIGIVDRNDLGTYITLSRKPLILLDAINNGLEEGIFLDADGIAKENIDTAFEYLSDCTSYPLVGEGMFEYMMLDGRGDPFVGDTLEKPLMDLLGVTDRTMYYVATNFILFTNKMKPFIEEWAKLADHPTILSNNSWYAPYHDETLVNVLLWKHKATKRLPVVHYNLTNSTKADEFYNSTIRDGVTDSDWHYIPADISDIKYFHGCKSLTEIDKTIKLIKSRRNETELNYHYKKFKFSDNAKIAMVTLFDAHYTGLANIAVPNHLEYAAKHGYDYIYFDETIDKSRPPQWSKVKAVEYLLNEYDWVWWLDVDALVINFDTKLENIIDNNYDMIFTANKYSIISNGSSFYKNTQITKNFLNECYTLERDILRNVDIQVFDHEQQPMRELYLNVPEYGNRIKLVHERVCNSFWYTDNKSALEAYPSWNKEDSIYKPGDFVVNFCGRTKDERIEVMSKFVNKILP
jgi:mannan polymerase II complex MNN10 subunit